MAIVRATRLNLAIQVYLPAGILHKKSLTLKIKYALISTDYLI